MSSNIKITKICERCGKSFTAQKTTTQYCSHSCSAAAYKARKRAEKLETVAIQTTSKTVAVVSRKDMLSVTEAARLLGVTRPTLYRWLEVGKLPFAKFDTKVLIRKADIDSMFESTISYQERISRNEIARTDYYSVDEIVERYGYDRSWIFRELKRLEIGRVFYRGRALYSREQIELSFKPKEIVVESWISVEEAMQHFGKTRDSLYYTIKEYRIPKVKSGKHIKISKEHLTQILQ